MGYPRTLKQMLKAHMQSEAIKGKEGKRRRKACEALAAENFPELMTDASHMTDEDFYTPSSIPHRSGRTISGAR